MQRQDEFFNRSTQRKLNMNFSQVTSVWTLSIQVKLIEVFAMLEKVKKLWATMNPFP